MSRTPGTTLAAVVLALVAACDGGPTAVTPLRNASALNVQFTTTGGIPVDGLPRATITGQQGGVRVKLDVVGPCSTIADARADYSGTRVDVWMTRSTNPAAFCAPAAIGYEYDISAIGLGAGPYDVRVVDQFGDMPPQVVARATVSVSPVP